jgi:hypothetical protein
MNDRKLSDRERALLAAARREIEAKKAHRPVADTPGSGRPGSRRGSDARGGPPTPVSPLDSPTVVGWDHPAAQGAPETNEDKWARVAALMEAERAEENAKRRRMRKFTIVFVAVGLVIVLLALARMLAR